jgi:hypothetical protein
LKKEKKARKDKKRKERSEVTAEEKAARQIEKRLKAEEDAVRLPASSCFASTIFSPFSSIPATRSHSCSRRLSTRPR